MLEGGIEGRPGNVLFYATSNRRHLLPRDMMDNERATAINPGEAVEEKVSLSDRFGLWLGFHRCSQDEYLAMVFGYADHYGLDAPRETIARDALEWATTRGSRSGRTAWQFTQDLAGRLERRIDPIGAKAAGLSWDPPRSLDARGPIVSRGRPAGAFGDQGSRRRVAPPRLQIVRARRGSSWDRPASNPCAVRSATAARRHCRSGRIWR